MTEGRRPVGYIRVSSDEHAREGVSLERQEHKIRTHCDLLDLPEPDILCDAGYSGFRDDRPGYRELVIRCRARTVSHVIVHDLSRLSRRLLHTLEFAERIAQPHGVELVSLTERIDTSSPSGKALFQITGVFAEMYRNEIALKTRTALAHRKALGQRYTGIVPYGFESPDGRILSESHTERQTLSLIRSLRDQGLSYQAIARELTKRGVPTKTGRSSWHPFVIQTLLKRGAS